MQTKISRQMNKLVTLLLLLIGCISCESNSAQTSNNLDVKNYLEQITSKKDIQIIDVRTPEEFESGHLENAVNIDFKANDFEQKINKIDKSKPTYIYCLSGGRSSSAQTLMTKNGFQNVINMKGGILEWKANHYPLANVPAANAGWKGMTKEAYLQLTQNKTPILFDFKAKWCGPCKQLAPILDEIAKEYPGQIIIMPIDIDENKSLADDLKIRSIPFLMYYKNGKLAMNIEGLTDKNNLIQSLGLKK